MPLFNKNLQQYLAPFLAGGLVAAISYNAIALEYDVSLYSELGHESNSTLNNNHIVQSDTLSTLGSTIFLAQKGQRFDLNTEYTITYTSYKSDTNDDGTRANGSTNALLDIIERLFSWQFSHGVTETIGSQNTPETADNLRTRNQFATGPILTIPINDTNSLNLTATYQHVDFDNDTNQGTNNVNADSKSHSASAAWQHALSATSNFDVNYNYNETERHSSNNTQTFQTAYIGYNQKLRSSGYTVQLGGNSSKSNISKDSDGLYYRGEYNYDFGNQQVTFSASKQKSSTAFGDTGFNNQRIDINSSDNALLGQQNLEEEGAVDSTLFEFNYNSSMYCNRCDYGFHYSHLGSDYVDSINDEQVDSYTLRYHHRFTRNFDAKLDTLHARRRFDPSKELTEDTTTNLSFAWQKSQALLIRFGTSYTTRKSDHEEDIEYDNTSAFIALEYALLSSNRPLTR